MGYYERNLEALEVNHPELVERLDQPIDARHIEVIYARSGVPRLLVRREDGTEVAVHNEDDPMAVAERTAEKIELGEEGVLTLFGMGLGYLPKALLSKMKDGHALIIYEADPGIFKIALEQTDLTDLLESKRVKVLVGKEVRLEPWFHYFLIKFGGKLQAIQYHPAFKVDPETYEQKLHQEFLPFVNATGLNITTITVFGRLFAQNVVEAIPEVVNTPGVNHLKDLFPRRPAILVAGGPSLAKNVHLLKRAKGRAVLIAADTMIGYLLARGIVPDFVVSVDPQEQTYDKYRGVDIPEEIALVYHPGCSEKIFQCFPGPKFVTATFMAPYLWLSPFWGERDSIEGDTQCQMHLGFNLARWLGADPILFVGQDLCYTDRRMHAKGGSYLTPEQEEQIVSQGLVVADIFGERVGTYPVFDSYRVTFERKIKEFPGRCIQATEGGVRIEGAEAMRLEEVLAEFGDLPPIEVRSVLRSLPAGAEKVRWSGLIREVRERERNLARVERLARRILKLIGRIERVRPRGGAEGQGSGGAGELGSRGAEEIIGAATVRERKSRGDHRSRDRKEAEGWRVKGAREADLLASLTNEAERSTTEMQRYGKALDLLPLLDYPLELYLLREETAEIDTLEDMEERLERQLERGRRYYGDLVRVVPPFREALHRLADRLERQRRLDKRMMEILGEPEGNRPNKRVARVLGEAEGDGQNIAIQKTFGRQDAGPTGGAGILPAEKTFLGKYNRLKSAATAEALVDLAEGYAGIDRYDQAIRCLEQVLGSAGAGEQRGRGAGERRSGGAEEPGSGGAGERGSRGAGELGIGLLIGGPVCRRLGKLYLIRNQLTRAREMFEQALVWDSQDVEAQTELEACGEQLGRWEERVRAAQQEEQERKTPGPLEAGDFYSRVGDFRRAAAAYGRAIEEQPDLLEAYERLAQAHLALGEPEQALEALEEQLRLAPSDPIIYYQLGRIALEHGQVDSAERFLREGAEVSSNDPGFCEACGDLFLEAGNCEKAVAIYQLGLEAGPIPELLKKIAQAYQQLF